MKYENKQLEELCEIKMGLAVSRVKKNNEEADSKAKRILLPKAISNGRIDLSLLETEEVGEVKGAFKTQEGDVILKTSTPYDCAYIEKESVGLVVTSFGLIIRKKLTANIDMKFLAMYLNSSVVASIFAAKSDGQQTVKLLRRAAVASLEVPLLPLDEQRRLAALFKSTNERKAQCEKLIKLDEELIESQLIQAIWGE